MYAITKGTAPPKPCMIQYRKEEKLWVFPEAKDVSVVFEVNFDTVVDISLARIFLLELKDSKRAVMSAPGIDYQDKDVPQEVKKNFPNSVTKFPSNGLISFKLGAPHLKKGIDEPLSQLIGFRQFMHFHLHAIKIQLHSRMRKRVTSMELIVRQARRDEEGPKTYKEKQGGLTEQDAKEEKKKEEVFNNKAAAAKGPGKIGASSLFK